MPIGGNSEVDRSALRLSRPLTNSAYRRCASPAPEIDVHVLELCNETIDIRRVIAEIGRESRLLLFGMSAILGISKLQIPP